MKTRTSAAAVTILASVAALVAPGIAQAAHLGPQYEFTFTGSGTNQIGNAATVAVDDQSHDVYVADRANHRVEKFDETGHFILMFGDGVNQTKSEQVGSTEAERDVCTLASGNVCREGQMSSANYPHFSEPSSIAVDNSNSPSKGDIYVGDTGDGVISKFTPDGQIVTSWGKNGQLGLEGEFIHGEYGFVGMTIAQTTGYLWVVERSGQISSWDDRGFFSFRTRPSLPYSLSNGNPAVDSGPNVYFEWGQGPDVKVNIAIFETEFRTLGPVSPEIGAGMAVDPTNDEFYEDHGSYGGEYEVRVYPQSCEPSTGYCTPREIFGLGHIVGGEGLALDPGTGAVYVATDNGVAFFKPLVIPDVTLKDPPTYGHESASVSAHVDPAGGGDIIDCKVEYGTSTSYGSSVPCDQSTPISGPEDVTATVPGLTTETPYHFRFVATNANGHTNGEDQVVTPHWVLGLSTGGATDIGPGSATLHGNLDPNGEDTHYYFEWGTTTAYGHETPAIPGEDGGEGSGDTPVAVELPGLLTSQTTYHYRIVASNQLGTSAGLDREFSTPLPTLPQVQAPVASDVALGSAMLGGQVNPGFGDTAFVIQYGPTTSYGSRTVVSDPIGNDGNFHQVQAEVEGLQPGRTYHFRVVAFNFKGTVDGADGTFTTPELPAVLSSSPQPLSPSAERLSAQVAVSEAAGATTIHFEYGTTPAYGLRTAESAVDAAGRAASDVTGLAPSTTYHFRVVASNAFGSTAGPDETFTTQAVAPEEHREQAQACKKGFVRKKGHCVKRHKRHPKSHRHGHRHGARG